MKKMTLKQAEEKYGEIEGYKRRLRELSQRGNMLNLDVEETLRDINFIREQAGLKEIDEIDLVSEL